MELIEKYPVAVLGAGPVGLAAANLIEYGISPLVFEADATVAASFRDYGHVKLFSPWRYNIDRASRRMLEAHAWAAPDADVLPTAGELLRDYLEPLAALPAIANSLKLGSRVIAVARRGYDKVKSVGREQAPFVIRVEHAGKSREYLAGAVIDATGIWSWPNTLGANGLPALGESRLAHRIRYGMPDIAGDLRLSYLGRTTLVVGADHSAVGSLVALAELAEADPATTIHWALRGASPRRADEPAAFLPALSAECQASGGKRDEAAFPPYALGGRRFRMARMSSQERPRTAIDLAGKINRSRPLKPGRRSLDKGCSCQPGMFMSSCRFARSRCFS